jgi:hypothetical protein
MSPLRGFDPIRLRTPSAHALGYGDAAAPRLQNVRVPAIHVWTQWRGHERARRSGKTTTLPTRPERRHLRSPARERFALIARRPVTSLTDVGYVPYIPWCAPSIPSVHPGGAIRHADHSVTEPC